MRVCTPWAASFTWYQKSRVVSIEVSNAQPMPHTTCPQPCILACGDGGQHTSARLGRGHPLWRDSARPATEPPDGWCGGFAGGTGVGPARIRSRSPYAGATPPIAVTPHEQGTYHAGRHRYHTAGGGCRGATGFGEARYPVYTLFAILQPIALPSYVSAVCGVVLMSSCRHPPSY